MKWLNVLILVVIILLTTFESYPHAMLKTVEKVQVHNEVKIVDKVYKDRNEYLDINVIIPQIVGLNNKDMENKINNKIIMWTEEWINDVRKVADEYYKDKPTPFMSYQLYSRYKVTNKANIISFFIDYYQFTGGAHGITTRVAYNIDENTGQELKLVDLFNKDVKYKEIINKEINQQIAKNPDRYFQGPEGFKGVMDNEKFYIKNNSIVIYFGLYEIAPYASGISEFLIPNKLFEENLKYNKI